MNINNTTENATENTSTSPVIIEYGTNAQQVQPPAQPNVEFEDGAEDDLLYGEDEAGNSLKGMPLAARASVTTPVEFKTMGEKHKCEVIFANVSYSARRAPDEAAENMSVQYGIVDPGDSPEKALEAQRALDSDRGYQGARVAMALQAVKRDDKGRLRVSVPFLRTANAKQLTDALCNPATPEQELEANYVRTFISAVNRSVNDFFNPSDPISTT